MCVHTHAHKSTFTNIDSCQELSLVMIYTLKSVTVGWSETILTSVKISFLFSDQDAQDVLMCRYNFKPTLNRIENIYHLHQPKNISNCLNRNALCLYIELYAKKF